MKPLGFGQYTGIDIQGEVRGVLPSQEWKRNYYKRPEQKKWYRRRDHLAGHRPGLQQLHHAAAGAGHGHAGQRRRQAQAAPRDGHAGRGQPCQGRRCRRSRAENLGFKPEHVAVVRKAMVGVTQEGTSTRVFAGAGYLSGGKTGTAQAVTHGAEGEVQRRQAGRAPARPRACTSPSRRPTTRRSPLPPIVENAGFGAAAAAPIARRVFDYWLMGQYPSEEDLAAVQQGQGRRADRQAAQCR